MRDCSLLFDTVLCTIGSAAGVVKSALLCPVTSDTMCSRKYLSSSLSDLIEGGGARRQVQSILSLTKRAGDVDDEDSFIDDDDDE